MAGPCGRGRLGFYDNHINELRRSFGLAPIRGNALKAFMTAARTVMLVSRHYYGDGAADWAPVTWGGFSHWAGPAGQQLDPAVADYIDAGDAPGARDARYQRGHQCRRPVRDHCRRPRPARAAVTAPRRRPNNLKALDGRAGAFAFAPVSQVLPRCRVAVVSGALGSMAAALAAGVPVVIVPQLFDQYWHGGRVEALGVGVMARARRPSRAGGPDRGRPGYRQRAEQLAAAMAGEDGPAVLADAVESVL